MPRYPSNVYYNVSRQAQQLDEYNWIYVLPPAGGCVPVEGVTTCRTTPATWAEYVTSENRVMFRHVVDNDPRPHYIHQSNLADYNPALPETHPDQGGIAYPVFGGLVTRYETAFDRASAPLVQLTHTQIGQTLAQQNAWAANRSVTAWLQDGRVHVKNTGTVAADVPLTGTTAGAAYGGQNAGWITLAPGAEQVLDPSDPANTAAPKVAGTARVGETLTADKGTWTGTPTIAYATAGSGARPTAPSARPSRARPPRSTNWRRPTRARRCGWSCWPATGSRRSARPLSAATVVVGEAPKAESPPSSGGQGETPVTPATPAMPGSGPSPKPSTRPTRLKLTKVKLAPRRFAVSHKRLPKGTKLDGTRVTFNVNVSAKVRLIVQRRTTGKRPRWVTAYTVTRSVKAGSGEVRLTGRFGKRLLEPARLPARGVGVQARAAADRHQADRLPRREGLKRWPPATSTAPAASRGARTSREPRTTPWPSCTPSSCCCARRTRG